MDSRRVVFVKDGRKRAGGYGIVRRAELHRSAYLPTWFASRQYGPPQVVAVKQMRMSVADDPLSLKAVSIRIQSDVQFDSSNLGRHSPRSCWCGQVSKHTQASPSFLASMPTLNDRRPGSSLHGSHMDAYQNFLVVTSWRCLRNYRL